MRVESGAVATQDLDLLFDGGKLRAYTSRVARSDARFLIGVLRKADPLWEEYLRHLAAPAAG